MREFNELIGNTASECLFLICHIDGMEWLGRIFDRYAHESARLYVIESFEHDGDHIAF